MLIESVLIGFQQIIWINLKQHILEDITEIDVSKLEFIVYPFSKKEMITIPIILMDTNCYFSFQLYDGDLMGQIFVDKLKANLSVEQNIVRSTCNFLCGSYIIHINGDPVYDTKGAKRILQYLYMEHIQDYRVVGK